MSVPWDKCSSTAFNKGAFLKSFPSSGEVGGSSAIALTRPESTLGEQAFRRGCLQTEPPLPALLSLLTLQSWDKSLYALRKADRVGLSDIFHGGGFPLRFVAVLWQSCLPHAHEVYSFQSEAWLLRSHAPGSRLNIAGILWQFKLDIMP